MLSSLLYVAWLSDYWEAFKSWLQSIIDWFAGLWTGLMGFLGGLLESIFSLVGDAFGWFFDQVLGLGIWSLNQLPDITWPYDSEAVTKIVGFLRFANAYLPVVPFLALVSALVLFTLCFIAVKMILKLIPTIG